ncbi:DUF445 domain-containing protein [Sphingomonas sp.]|uniref:DUF445 domain-containing protein n=1 Tax=Sphingomonas sp. TaxID=28214 RepID=UPI000DB7FACF|nr:DUF445 domain-containing protein [Sphingomonas sp.]PZU08811.1 MAG: DUF445 domain-containing protein [Sphingomonas sp.]
MRAVATGLLLAMAALFVVSTLLTRQHHGWAFVRAFAEAAMVGGLADWFAVTALFRHPLGLPIPHTAIIPRNKDRIGDSLAAFLRSNFLTPSVVSRRMKRLDLAAGLGRLLARPPSGKLRGGRLAATLLEGLADERLGKLVKGIAVQRLRDLSLAPLAGQLLSAAMAEGRHRPLIDGAIDWIGRTLDANEGLFRKMIHERAGSILRWTGLDETLSTKILEGLFKLLAEMADDPDHPLRAKTEEALLQLAGRLQHEPETQERVARFRDAMIANPAVGRWLDGMWESARAAMLRAVRDPQEAMAGRLGEMLRQAGETLQNDERLRIAVNRFARRATVGIVAAYGDGIVALVSDTIRGWDASTVTQRLETAVGRDLQYIRVNGTLVGGLVGLVIYAVSLAIG